MLAPYQVTGVVEQVEFEFGDTSGNRFYEISVTATDSAGRTHMDSCKVIVVPECDGKGDPNNCEIVEGVSFHNTDAMKETSEISTIRLYPLASAQLTWDFGLLSGLDSLPSAMPSDMPSDKPSEEKKKKKPKGS